MTFHLNFEQPTTKPIIDHVSGKEAHLVGRRTQFPAKLGDCLLFDGETHLEFALANPLSRREPWSVGLWLFPTTSDDATLLGRFESHDDRRGYELALEKEHVVVRLIHKSSNDGIRLRTKQPLPQREWHHVLVTYDGSSQAAGLCIYVDGEVVPSN